MNTMKVLLAAIENVLTSKKECDRERKHNGAYLETLNWSSLKTSNDSLNDEYQLGGECVSKILCTLLSCKTICRLISKH